MKKICIISVFLLFSFTPSYAQKSDTALISSILQSIASAQVSANGEFYAGSFPSYRECAGIPHNYQPDNNIYYTAISVFALRNLITELNTENNRTASAIIENAQKAFPYYRDKDGNPFYSFWPTGKGILPHSYLIKKINAVNMGQDADDAVISLLATAASDSDCSVLKQRMAAVSNLSKKKISSTYPQYRDIPAYSTWLGLRMKPDFDLGVHCNILYFMFEKGMPLVKQDSATIQLLAAILKNRDYKRSPAYISPYYAKTSVLLYHITRLMGRFIISALEPYRAQLIDDTQQELVRATKLMDRILLSTSLLRLGVKPPLISIQSISEFEKYGTDRYVFFQARAAFSYSTPFKQILLHWSYMRYYFYCPVWNKIMWLEYLIERNKV